MSDAPEPTTTTALSISRDGVRITVAGEVRTPADRDLLKDVVLSALAELVAHPDVVSHAIILDVSRAAYLDTTALTALITIARKCSEAGVTMVLETINDDMVEQMRLTKLDQILSAINARVKP
jgi:anti-anti-sigma factor